MQPISEVYKKIPEDALLSIKEIFSPSEYDKIIQSFRIKRNTTFRVNTLKSNKNETISFLRTNGFKIKEIVYIDNGFSLDSEQTNKLLKTELAKEGKIYLQSISSMIPPIVLAPNSNDIILDMASAPGSKTSQLAALMNNNGKIIAVEEDKLRIERLKYNLTLLGVTNTELVLSDGRKYCREEESIFDKILLDAPCSGEGRFNIFDRQSYALWKKPAVLKFSNLQKRLLTNALKLVKEGGTIVYSTCTLNLEENEEVINFILENTNYQIEIIEIDKIFTSLLNTKQGITKIGNRKYNDSIKRCLRIMPSNDMEGFFISKIKKIKL